MTIVAVIVVIIFGAFRVGVRAWEKGESDIENHQRYRIVLNLINRQMSSINLRKVEKDGKEELLLKGDGKSFQFVSNISLMPDNEYGMVYARYEISETEDGKQRLVFFEKNLVFFNEENDFAEIDRNDYYELIPGAQEISFEYLKIVEPDKTREWQDSWNSEDGDKIAPLAVRVNNVPEPETAPVSVIAPINQESDENAKM